MIRIAGINIPENKRLEIALTYIYGIGRSLSREVLKKAKLPFDLKTSQLKPTELSRLKEIIEKEYKTEGELRQEVRSAIKRLKDISSWRGLRHLKGLPVRGQTTRTNSRTIRGNVRKTMGSGKKLPPAPK
jgi:small subunit ribosomal protein S13